jgi:hypothetical protein
MSIIDNFKDMLKIADAANNLDLYKNLSELQTSVQALQEENRKIQDDNKNLKEALELKAKMIHKPPFFYQDGDPTPFCPACWEGGHKPVHLIYSHEEESCFRWDCKTCKQMFLINKPIRRQQFVPGYGSGGPNSWME